MLTEKSSLLLYDTTLRDGAQGAGVAFTTETKLRALKILDDLGMDYIEGGWPGSNPTETEFFERTKNLDYQLRAKLSAFGSTRRAAIDVEDDPVLQALVEAKTPVCTLVGKSSLLQVEKVLRTTPAENLSMISESVSFLKAKGLEVGFDAEHFFDGYKKDPSYALETLEAAVKSGVDWIALCDTNGGTSMNILRDTVRTIVNLPQITIPLGIHTHNDRGLANANTLVAVEEGVRQVQGTINGYGERTGNACLLTFIAYLAEEGWELMPSEKLARLTSISRSFEQLTGCPTNPNSPYFGPHAYRHKAGYHADGVGKDPTTYEHIPPETFGNNRSFEISGLAGSATIIARINELNLPFETDRHFARQITERIKELTSQGFQYDTRSASFEILVRRMHPEYQPSIDLEIQDAEQPTPKVILKVNDHISKEGKPNIEKASFELLPPTEDIQDMFRTMKEILANYYPYLNGIALESHRTQAINGHAKRVFVELSDGRKKWTAVYATKNNLIAGWNALTDAMEYAILHSNC